MIHNVSMYNNSNQNFGFKVKVKENGNLLDMAKSKFFAGLSEAAIERFETRAEKVFPDKTIVLEPTLISENKGYKSYHVDFLDSGKKVDDLHDYYPHAVFTYVSKATNPYSSVHSRFFYKGGHSPETLLKIHRIKKASGTL